VRLLALSTDGVDDGSGRGSLKNASELMQLLKLPFPTGAADGALLRNLRTLQANTFYKDKPLSMPTSFLIDGDGEIAIIYRGVVDVKQVMADADLIQTTDSQRIETALYPLGGRSGIGLLPVDELGFAKAYYEAGYYADVRRTLAKFIGRTTTSAFSETNVRQSGRQQNLAEAYHLLAQTEEADAHLEAAEQAYRNGLRFAPQALGSRVSLAIVLWKQGKQAEADAQLHTAERDGTSLIKTHKLLGRVRMQFGQPKQAARHFRKALQQSPGDQQLGLELAVALQADGRIEDAVAQYRQLLASNPSFLQAANNLAWIYATSLDQGIRNAEESLRLALQVCRATENQKSAYLDTLAAAYAANGQFTQAISAARQAIDVAEKANQEDMAEKIRQRLKAYQQNKPYQEPVRPTP
jgi:tetratricopeptide (TPR) repeat protein